MLTILAFTSAALASEARHEVSVSFGNLQSNDPAWGIVGGKESPNGGIRAGYGVNPWLTVIGSWELSRISNDHAASYYDYEYGYEDVGHGSSGAPGQAVSGGVFSELSIHHLSVGAKYSHAFLPWLVPYATTQGVVHVGGLRVSDNLDRDEATINIDSSGVGFGGIVSGGIELRSKPYAGSFSLAAHLEFGYALSSNMNFSFDSEGSSADIGSLGYNGPTISAGVGLRF